jgi:hypothetical protein
MSSWELIVKCCYGVSIIGVCYGLFPAWPILVARMIQVVALRPFDIYYHRHLVVVFVIHSTQLMQANIHI